MSLQHSLLRTFYVFACFCAALPVVSTAAPNGVSRLESRLEIYAGELQKLQQEFEFTQYKRRSTEEKLKQLQEERSTREAQLIRLRESLGDAPSAEQREALENEAQRVALAELGIKSQIAAISRLERKEQELQDTLNATRSNISKTEKEIATAKARAQSEEQARNLAIQQQLAALKEENERLRLAMEEEARRAEEAARQAELAQIEAVRRAEEQAAALAAQIAAQQAAQEAAAPAAPSPEASTLASPVVDDTPDLSQVVLEGEPPIYWDEDTIKITIRSRSIDTPVTMLPIGPALYRAEVSVDPGRAFFDVRNRRYRGYFPDKQDSDPYVFYYDLSGERPKMYVRTKSNDDQVVSNAKDPF